MNVWEKLGMVYRRNRPYLRFDNRIDEIARAYLPGIDYVVGKTMIIKLCLMKNISTRGKKKLLQRLANDPSTITTFITTIIEDMPTGLKTGCYNV